MDHKIRILLTYIEEYEKDYSDSMTGLEMFLDGVVVNNDEPVKSASKELLHDLKAYLTAN